MENKFDVYDLLTALIPGSLVLLLLIILFSNVVSEFVIKDSAIKVLLFVVVAFILGHILISIKSVKLWKDFAEGTDRHPSSFVFSSGLGDSIMSPRIANSIKKRIGDAENSKNLSDEEAFVLAMKYSEMKPSSKLHKIYALHEFYRVMMVAVAFSLFLIFIAIMCGNYWSNLKIDDKIIAFLFVFLVHSVIFLLFRDMAKTRAKYWVREVLLSASRALV